MSERNGTTPKKIACLGMPSYGELTAGAARGFFRASRDKHLDLRLQSQESSLLALNMNILWAWALNTAKDGRIDYFACQHSDIEPEDFWLDKAIEELEAKDLDVLGVVAPIKDPRGVTSTALARPDGSTWRVHCRLTMREIHRLPETFTSEDVGYPILLNTGLWVCRFREDWARKCHFTINDRIVWSDEAGKYVPEVEPEDWFFSRLLHECGLRVGCTRKIAIGHRGGMVFGNTKAWGEADYDREYLKESALPEGVRLPDWFPDNSVDGWLTEAEGLELARLGEGKDVLEIGSYCGRSTICLAQKAESVKCIDTFDGRATPTPGSTLQKFMKNIAAAGLTDRVEYLVGTSEMYLGAELEPLERFETFWMYDLIFIDGDHSLEAVQTDIRLALNHLRPGGLIAFHDYRESDAGELDGRWDPGVTEAVNDLLASGGEMLGRFGSLAVVRPPAKTLSLVEN